MHQARSRLDLSTLLRFSMISLGRAHLERKRQMLFGVGKRRRERERSTSTCALEFYGSLAS